MENKTYTDQDRTDIFSNHIKGFIKNKELQDAGHNVFWPRALFGTFYNSNNCYIDIVIDLMTILEYICPENLKQFISIITKIKSNNPNILEYLFKMINNGKRQCSEQSYRNRCNLFLEKYNTHLSNCI